MSRPPLLQNAVTQKRLVIFCGAGLSMLSPSNLPSWYGYNTAILDEAKQRTLDNLPTLPLSTAQAIQDLSLEKFVQAGFSLAGFSEKFTHLITEKQYLPLLSILDSDQTNANHRALVELARQGILQAIVSTNFDTLIERAFDEANLPLRVLASDQDYQQSNALGACTLYKVHGTANNPESMKDTVSQKLRGLSPIVRETLADLFKDCHTLVMGFSGADLQFNPDYFSFLTIDDNSPGITFAVQTKETTISPHIQKVIESIGSKGSIWRANLPDLFIELGVTADVSKSDTNNLFDSNAHAAQQVRNFYDALPLNGWFASALFCANFLELNGQTQDARTVYQLLIPNTDVTLMRHMGNSAFQDGDWETALTWFNRELEEYSRLTMIGMSKSGEVQSTVNISDRVYGGNKARVWSSIATTLRGAGRFDEAEQALKEVEKFDPEQKNPSIWAHIYEIKALKAQDQHESPDKILALWEKTKEFAQQSGDGDILYESHMSIAQLLNELVEYDMAYKSLQEAKALSGLLRGERSRYTETRLTVELLISRNQTTEARALIYQEQNQAKQKKADPWLIHLYDWLFCRQCAWDIRMRPEIFPKLSSLIGAIKNNPALQAKIDIAEVINFQKYLPRYASGGVNAAKSVPKALTKHEVRLRQSLAHAEFKHKHKTIYSLFFSLCQLKYNEHNPERLYTLSLGYEQAVRDHAGPIMDLVSALNWKAIALGVLHDLEGALEAYAEAIAVIPEKYRRERAKLIQDHANLLALIQSEKEL